jgi:hypothetical protein
MEINFKPLILNFQTYFVAIILVKFDVHYHHGEKTSLSL